MPFRVSFTPEALEALDHLDKSDRVRARKVKKTIGQLEVDPRYPGLNSHKYATLKGANGEDVWECYVENKTPAAFRVFWHYGPATGELTVVAITRHP
ncbi:MAG TPA: hypothetical protein VFJ58_18705 [Armatimonadota bacterium]|nr:hypothetical protein [Armatimonadota bacterium]